MGETTDQIERAIAGEGRDLGRNLAELEAKAKALTDWRAYVEKSPMTMLGVAFGGGILLAMLAGGRRGRTGSRRDKRENGRTDDRGNGHHADGQTVASIGDRGDNSPDGSGGESWSMVKGALVGVASRKVMELLDDVVPHFREDIEKHRANVAMRAAARPVSYRR